MPSILKIKACLEKSIDEKFQPIEAHMVSRRKIDDTSAITLSGTSLRFRDLISKKAKIKQIMNDLIDATEHAKRFVGVIERATQALVNSRLTKDVKRISGAKDCLNKVLSDALLQRKDLECSASAAQYAIDNLIQESLHHKVISSLVDELPVLGTRATIDSSFDTMYDSFSKAVLAFAMNSPKKDEVKTKALLAIDSISPQMREAFGQSIRESLKLALEKPLVEIHDLLIKDIQDVFDNAQAAETRLTEKIGLANAKGNEAELTGKEISKARLTDREIVDICKSMKDQLADQESPSSENIELQEIRKG